LIESGKKKRKEGRERGGNLHPLSLPPLLPPSLPCPFSKCLEEANWQHIRFCPQI